MPKRWCTAHEVEHVASAFAKPGSRVCKKATKDRLRTNSRSKHLQDNYGLTLEDYARILAAQGGVCACGCGAFGKGSEAEAKAAGKRARPYHLHVDHDHKLQADLLASGLSEWDAARLSVRGLLCARSNKLLRDARDSVETLTTLTAYLKKPPARKVLR